MSVEYLPEYNIDGRLKGSFVYMLLCRDSDGPVYVKVGRSHDPFSRLKNLKNTCAVTPRVFSTVNVRSVDCAKKLEADLLNAYRCWKTTGEWMRLPIEKKSEFNKIWQQVFAKYAEKHWPLSWTQVSVEEFTKKGDEALRFYRRRYAMSSRAYQDFCSAS